LFHRYAEDRIWSRRYNAIIMTAAFRAHNIPREALVVVLLFQEAVHREAAAAELARKIAVSINRASGARRSASEPR
jgi:hypothetical protein